MFFSHTHSYMLQNNKNQTTHYPIQKLQNKPQKSVTAEKSSRTAGIVVALLLHAPPPLAVHA